MSELYRRARSSTVDRVRSRKVRPQRVLRQRQSMTIESLENRCMLATIHGQMWNDVDGNGQRDPGEPGFDGGTIELFDPAGMLIAATTAAGADLNGNGAIDPETESGAYQFTALAPGTYVVRPSQPEGWRATTADPRVKSAAALDEHLGGTVGVQQMSCQPRVLVEIQQSFQCVRSCPLGIGLAPQVKEDELLLYGII